MKTLPLVSIIAAIGISLTPLAFTYQHVQDCEAQGGSITGFLTCNKSEYRLLLEEKKPFVKISLYGFKPAQAVGHPLNDFTIKLEGYYPSYNSPDIILKDEIGNAIWTNYDYIAHAYFARQGPAEFCKEYQFYDIGGPITINKTGTYKFVFSFAEFSEEKEIRIFENVVGGTAERSNFHCSQSDSKNSEKSFPTHSKLNVTKITFENYCTNDMICYGNFDNGTMIRISCDDIPLHGCGVQSFDYDAVTENEN